MFGLRSPHGLPPPHVKSEATTIALNWPGVMLKVLKSMVLGLCSSIENGGEPPYAATIVALLSGASLITRVTAQGRQAPTFQVDPTWPALPNNWVLGTVT